MSVFTPSVTCLPDMAAKRKPSDTDQANFRMKRATLDRMERYRDTHPLHPTLTQIVEAAVNAWLDANEGKLDAAKRPRK